MNSHSLKTILVPIDFSRTSICAAEHAALLAKKTGAEVTFIHVLEPVADLTNKVGLSTSYMAIINEKIDSLRQEEVELEQRIEDEAIKKLRKLENRLKKDGISVNESIIETGKVAKKISSIAKKISADIIVMGTHGASGVREFMVGSNTYKVVSEAVCPVLSLKEKDTIPGFKTILLPFIDKPHMREHVDYAIALAKIYGATIHILGIDTEKDTTHFKKVRQEADQISKIAEKSGVKASFDVFPSSYANQFIMSYGKEKKADLIVIMSDMNKLGLMQYLTGPVVQQIVNHAPIPVLSVPPKYNPNAVLSSHYHSAVEPLF